MQQFTDVTKRALQQFVTDRLNERLKSALGEGAPTVTVAASASTGTPEAAPPEPDRGVVTTEEEIEAFHMVKAIMREKVDPRRVVMRDTASHCGVLLDDNNRKPICRFRFGATKRSIGLFDANKEEERLPLSELNDIYQYADRLQATVGFYDK